MRWFAILLPLLVLAPTVRAEEEAGTTCGLHAFLDDHDAGLQKVYDGLRKGLELAQLPRVCRVDEPKGGATAFLERLSAQASIERQAGRPVGPVFAIGDGACSKVIAAATRLPRVYAVERYTVGRKPLRPLPADEGAAIIYAGLDVEAVGRLLRELSGLDRPSVAWAWDAKRFPRSGHQPVMRFAKGAGLRLTGAEKGNGASALLHLRLGVGETLLPFADALRLARELGVPLISDDRGRFGQGAAVTLVGRHALMGRRVAAAARHLRTKPSAKLPPRGVAGIEVWIDLKSADAFGVKMPMALLARADRLKRGIRRPAKDAK